MRVQRGRSRPAARHARRRPGHGQLLGHLPDLDPWFEGLRLTVAPLRYGAGLKGKVISSLAAGVPCVGTSVAMEGMAVRDGEAALVADTPEGLAQRIVRGALRPRPLVATCPRPASPTSRSTCR